MAECLEKNANFEFDYVLDEPFIEGSAFTDCASPHLVLKFI